ncbi:MAG: PAS domain S-box protein, partial [Leptospiraceae bacterium]|nr:PAS domain S-box protein [Leptospiraceae bacterium]
MEMENNIRLDSLTREELESLYIDTVRKNNVEREELQSKTEELSDLVETIPLGIYIYRTKKNGSTQFDYLSERCIDLLGLEQAGIDLQSILEDGRNLFKTVHPDDFDGFVKTSNSAIQSLEQYSWEGRFIVNGKIRWIRAESLPSLQPNGDVLWNGFVTDISERKAIELSVRKERDRAQNYLDAVETIIIVLDVRGNVTTINRKGCQILGYSEEEMLGALWFQKCLPQPEGMEKNYPDFLEMISSCKDLDLRLEFSENPVITRSGNLRQIAWHNILLRDNESRLIGIVCSGEDITDRRQAEEEILKSKIFS